MIAFCFGRSSDSTESLNADISGDPLYQNHEIGRIHEGLAFFIRGKLLVHGDRFIIDFGLENSNKDLALRVAVRSSTNSLGRNSRIRRVWGKEETDTAIPFSLSSGCNFEIQVLMTAHHIFIAFNGVHLAKFVHRLPFHKICGIEIRGDIKDVLVDRDSVTAYPTRPDKTPHIARLTGKYAVTANLEDLELEEIATAGGESEGILPLPYYAIFDKGFLDFGYSISVKGQIRFNANTFKVAVQVGQNVWPQPSVALLLEFRFVGEPVVVRNSFANGRWTGEIISKFSTGLRPGAEFHLVVVRGRKSFEIYMNDKHLTDYPYKIKPKFVDTCFVTGDIRLYDVDIESD